MTEFETHPVGTGKRIAELGREPAGSVTAFKNNVQSEGLI